MRRNYLDSAATNLVDPRVLAKASEFTDMYLNTTMTTGDVSRAQLEYLKKARSAVAEFIGCDAKEIALMQSTSHALGTLSTSLSFQPGDNVLVCDLEYQASVVCWKAASERVGFEVREVHTSEGMVTADDFERYIDSKTKAILIAAVQEINGYRADTKEIAKMAHRHGCLLIVDGIQEVGALKVNVKELDVDFYLAGGKKWLGNPFGMGFMYIRKELLRVIKPPYYSYFDIMVPDEYDDYLVYLESPQRQTFDDFDLADDATVFETGGYSNFLGAMGLTEAINVLQEIGAENIERHNLALSRYLYDSLKKLGLNMQSSDSDKNMSSIVVFNFDGFSDGTSEKEKQLVEYLRAKNTFVTVRCAAGLGGVRISFHYYTTKENIKALIDEIKEYMIMSNLFDFRPKC